MGGVEALDKMGTPPLHRYEVVEKLKTATEVIVVCEYRHAEQLGCEKWNLS